MSAPFSNSDWSDKTGQVTATLLLLGTGLGAVAARRRLKMRA